MKKTISNKEEWPDFVYGAGPTLRSVDEGLNYFEVRMETLRATVLERNRQNAELEGSIFWYRIGFWLLAIVCGGLLSLLIGKLCWSFLEAVLS